MVKQKLFIKAPSEAPSPRPLLEPSPPLYVRARLGATDLANASSEVHAETGAKASVPTSPGPRHGRFLHQAPDPTAFGTALHRHLEFRDWPAFEAEATAALLDLSPFLSWLKTETAQKIFGSHVKSFPEFAFEWKTDKGVVTGRIDLLVELPSDELWIVDYKVFHATRSWAEVEQAYSSQLRLYKDAVKTLTKKQEIRAFILDVAGATGGVLNEVDCTNPGSC